MGSPYLSRHRESDPQGKPMEVWVQERGKSEGSSVMEGIGVEQTRKITPRESGQTSTRSPLTREHGKPIKEAKQMTVAATNNVLGRVNNGAEPAKLEGWMINGQGQTKPASFGNGIGSFVGDRPFDIETRLRFVECVF